MKALFSEDSPYFEALRNLFNVFLKYLVRVWGVPKQLEMALFGVQKDDFRWEVFPQNLRCIDPKHLPIFYLVGANSPKKTRKKTEPQFSLQTPGKSHCLVKEPQEVINRDFASMYLGICMGRGYLRVLVMFFWVDIWHGHLEWPRWFFHSQDQMNVLVRIDCYLGALQFGLPWMCFCFGLWVVKQHIGGVS